MVKENNLHGVYIQNLIEKSCYSAQDAFMCFKDGLKRKHTAETFRNHNSSRSHTIF